MVSSHFDASEDTALLCLDFLYTRADLEVSFQARHKIYTNFLLSFLTIVLSFLSLPSLVG
jgi:hypothetical protein